MLRHFVRYWREAPRVRLQMMWLAIVVTSLVGICCIRALGWGHLACLPFGIIGGYFNTRLVFEMLYVHTQLYPRSKRLSWQIHARLQALANAISADDPWLVEVHRRAYHRLVAEHASVWDEMMKGRAR